MWSITRVEGFGDISELARFPAPVNHPGIYRVVNTDKYHPGKKNLIVRKTLNLYLKLYCNMNIYIIDSGNYNII